mgnify:FL=1|jgi:hypothetical protein
MKKLKFKTICHNSNANSVKEDGYSVSKIITLLVMFPLMLLYYILLILFIKVHTTQYL